MQIGRLLHIDGRQAFDSLQEGIADGSMPALNRHAEPIAHPVEIVGGDMHIDGKRIRDLSEPDPAKLPWADLGVDIVLECTGVFTDRAKNQPHFDAGAKKVIISAPAKEPDITIVLGVNDEKYDPSAHHLLSNASCTTNCVSPPLKALEDAFGVSHAVINTTHAYTMSQALLDSPQKKSLRNGRAAAINLIPASDPAKGPFAPENGKHPGSKRGRPLERQLE